MAWLLSTQPYPLSPTKSPFIVEVVASSNMVMSIRSQMLQNSFSTQRQSNEYDSHASFALESERQTDSSPSYTSIIYSTTGKNQ